MDSVTSHNVESILIGCVFGKSIDSYFMGNMQTFWMEQPNQPTNQIPIVTSAVS